MQGLLLAPGLRLLATLGMGLGNFGGPEFERALFIHEGPILMTFVLISGPSIKVAIARRRESSINASTQEQMKPIIFKRPRASGRRCLCTRC